MFERAKGSRLESFAVFLAIVLSIVITAILCGLYPRHLDMVVASIMALSLAVSLASCISLLYGWFSIARYDSVF
jgi:hypothetical protein